MTGTNDSPTTNEQAGANERVLRIGAFLPTSTPDPERPILGDVRGAARLAEQLGLDSVWSPDHLIASAPILDSTVTLATAAAVTERIGIGYGVLLVALRPPAWAAKQIAALQFVGGGRLLLGVGTGNPAHGDIGFRAAEQSFADRGRRTDEALRILPDLIAGRPATLPGGTVAALAPGAPVPPILVTGDGPRGLRRTAEFGDGWISIGRSLDQFRESRAQLAELSATYNRPAPAPTIIVQLPPEVNAAADYLAGYADAGAERAIVAPEDPDWQSRYEYIAKVYTAL
jgi:alkanesulfonate monooxygenase SsuD/methylene tetrahydromethanopterin reductase-like flavin-dependent oxidoreductase (luciferase family)